MPKHLAAFFENVDQGGVLLPIAAVADQSITVNGDDVRVPVDLPFIIGEVGLTDATTLSAGQIQSPTLRATANIDMEPLVPALVFGSPPESMMHPMHPIAVRGDEDVTFHINSDDAAAQFHYGLIWFSDGAQQPINGEVVSVRATSTAVLATGAWVNSAITFDQALPVGRYAIVGMRSRGTNLVAARLVGVGEKWRPGVPAINGVGDLDSKYFRYGRMGTFLEFHTNTPPTIDCLGVTDATQTHIFDIIRL